MNTRIRLALLTGLAAAAVVILVAWMTGPAAHDTSDARQRGPEVLHTTWSYQPRSLSHMIDDAQQIAEADVVGVRDGAPLITRGPVHVAPMPTQLITMRTVTSLKGDVPRMFVIHKTGSARMHLEHDPPYKPGERYLLFLRAKRDADGLVMPLGPQARVLVDAEQVRPLAHGAASTQLGASRARLTRQIRTVVAANLSDPATYTRGGSRKRGRAPISTKETSR